MECVKTRR